MGGSHRSVSGHRNENVPAARPVVSREKISPTFRWDDAGQHERCADSLLRNYGQNKAPPQGGAAASRVEADEVYGLRGHDEAAAALGGRELGASEDRDREVTDLAYKLGWRVARAHEYRADRGVATTEARLAAAAQDALELVG